MNELEVRRFIDVIHPNNELFEIRVIDGKKTYSGYFTDSQVAYNAIKDISVGNVYIVFNKIKDACYGRGQRDMILANPKSTTSDGDVTDFQWLLIDIDPVRPSDCNSSESELREAFSTTVKIGGYLRNAGFSDPVFGMSGNGYHLLYNVKFPNTPTNAQTVKNFLQVLSMLYSNDMVGIDTSVHSPAQLTKLLGTVSRKGTSRDETRPQRTSKLLHIPKKITKNDVSLVQKVAALLPEPEKATYHNNYGRDSFDLDSFVSKSGISVSKDISVNGVRKLVLDECPFNSSHKAPDSAIFQLKNGAIGFKCLHNSCSHHTWHDLRDMYDGSRSERYSDNSRTLSPVKPVRKELSVLPEIEEKGAKFLQLHEIKQADRSKIVTIPTKFHELDKRIIGLNKGEVSLVSGSSGGGKSTFVNQIALNAINSGFKASIWSGELTSSRMKHWLHLQCAGRQYTTKSTFSENSFYVKSSIGERIDSWLKDKLYIYNNDYGNKFNQLMADIEEHVVNDGIDLLVLDNLMAMDIIMIEGDKMQQQTKMILDLVSLAKRLSVHLILIAHPRKVVTFLRKNDIAGNADLANAVDNVFIMHRVNNDFYKSAGDFYGNETATRYFSFSNVIEVCKNRDIGIQDELFGLFFESESKRFLNDRYESVQYGWVDVEQEPELDIRGFYTGFEVKDHPFDSEYENKVNYDDDFPF